MVTAVHLAVPETLRRDLVVDVGRRRSRFDVFPLCIVSHTGRGWEFGGYGGREFRCEGCGFKSALSLRGRRPTAPETEHGDGQMLDC